MTNREIYEKFLNYLMLNGNKSTAIKAFNDAMQIVYSATKDINHPRSPFSVFCEALKNIQPYYQFKSLRLHGRSLVVPTPIDTHKQFSLSAKMLIKTAKKTQLSSAMNYFSICKPNSSLISRKLSYQILEAFNKKGVLFDQRLSSLEQASISFNQITLQGRRIKKSKGV